MVTRALGIVGSSVMDDGSRWDRIGSSKREFARFSYKIDQIQPWAPPSIRRISWGRIWCDGSWTVTWVFRHAHWHRDVSTVAIGVCIAAGCQIWCRHVQKNEGEGAPMHGTSFLPFKCTFNEVLCLLHSPLSIQFSLNNCYCIDTNRLWEWLRILILSLKHLA